MWTKKIGSVIKFESKYEKKRNVTGVDTEHKLVKFHE